MISNRKGLEHPAWHDTIIWHLLVLRQRLNELGAKSTRTKAHIVAQAYFDEATILMQHITGISSTTIYIATGYALADVGPLLHGQATEAAQSRLADLIAYVRESIAIGGRRVHSEEGMQS